MPGIRVVRVQHVEAVIADSVSSAIKRRGRPKKVHRSLYVSYIESKYLTHICMRWRVQVIASSQPVATADPLRTRSARSHSSSQPVSRPSLREVISSRIMFLIVIFVLCVVKRILVNIFPIFFGNFPYFGKFPIFLGNMFPIFIFPIFFPRF